VQRELTPRQAQILTGVAEGLGDKEIARRLGVSTSTVRTHLQRFYRNHSIRNRAEAAAMWTARQPGANSPGAAEPAATSTPQPAPAPLLARLTLRSVPAVVALIALSVITGLAAFRPATGLIALYSAGRVGPEQAVHATAAASSTPNTVTPSGPTTTTPAANRTPTVAPSVASTPAPTLAPTATPLVATGGHSPETGHPSTGTPPPPANPPVAPAPKITVALDMAVLALVNADRATAAVLPVTWDSCLAQVATKSADRAAMSGYAPPLGQPPADGGCTGASGAVEIAIYWSATDDAKANSMLMANPQQRSAIFGPYHKLGAAWASTSTGVAYLVIELA